MPINNDIWYTTLTKVLDRQNILDDFLDSSIPQIIPEMQAENKCLLLQINAEGELKPN